MHSLPVHPATVDLKPLPLPPLGQTLGAYRTALSAVLSEEDLAHATRVIEDFAQGDGPLLDATLRDRAAAREKEGTNWLHDEWYEGYLENREPLQLSTNVGFQLAPFGDGTGTSRVASAVQRIATVHLQAAAQQVPEDVDARDNRITMNQWFVYNGGVRHPNVDVDDVNVCDRDVADREIGVFVRGRLFALPISDSAGNVAPLDQLSAAFDELLSTDEAADFNADFNAASLIGSGPLGDALSGLFTQNPGTYARLRDLLFTVDLVEAAGRSDAALLADLTFRPRGAWTYKPLSYQFGVDSPWTAVHVEHSCQDGATLVTALTRMHDVDVTESASMTARAPQELRWELDSNISDIAREVRSYTNITGDDAQPYTAEIAAVDINQPDDLPFKFSRDASAQLILSIAQQLTYGRVRAVYEAVDMREFRAGRTECLRAATPEAVAFARHLVDGDATQEQLVAAVDAHRAWVKRCKSGNGFDRHIQMLERLDERLPPAEFFTDETTIAARQDFLSTTSIGGADQIVRYAFAPTLPEGFGVAYTPLPKATEYCVSFNADTAERPEKFLRNLKRAAELLWEFCADL